MLCARLQVGGGFYAYNISFYTLISIPEALVDLRAE